jgi:tRNA (guanine-N7-)-methyltransferase
MRPFDPSKVPPPPDFRPLPHFPDRPFDIEIGCGVGFHPLRYAEANPERILVAFERTSDKFARFAGRLAHHKALPNLFPVHGDAIPWIVHGVKPDSVDRYFLLYPNPYPKESQRNLRFHEMPFFAFLRNTLKPGGALTLATNAEFYAQGAKAKLVADWGMKIVSESLLPADFSPRTHFEKKYLARGENCWNLVFSRA